MTDTPRDDHACREHRHLFFHLRRGELDDATAEGVRRHLEQCEACRDFDRLEVALDRVLLEALRREPLPEDVRARVLASARQVRKSDERSRSAWRPPWAQALAAAALLVVGMLIPGLVDRLRSGPPAPVQEVTTPAEVEWTGVLVDGECDRAGAPLRAQRDCSVRGHHTVFKTRGGEYLSLVPGAIGQLPVERDDRGRSVRVRGRYDPLAGTLALDALEML
jgi:hypothetical protein